MQGELAVEDRKFKIQVDEERQTFLVLEWLPDGTKWAWRMLPLSRRLHSYKSSWSAYLAAVIAIERWTSV